VGDKKMESQLAKMNMIILFERMLREQRAESKVAFAIKRLVKLRGEFNGKDASHYLQYYKAEMLRCGISEGCQVLSFNWMTIDCHPRE
jgi:hypothetical protein